MGEKPFRQKYTLGKLIEFAQNRDALRATQGTSSVLAQLWNMKSARVRTRASRELTEIEAKAFR